MFVESAFITREFKEGQIPILENVTCLSVVNTGNTVVVINGISIAPTQIQVLIPPDGTYSRVQLEKEFIPPTDPLIDGGIFTKNEVEKIIAVKVIPQNKILLIYKKLI